MLCAVSLRAGSYSLMLRIRGELGGIMLAHIVGAFYLGAGIFFAIWIRSSFHREADWFAVVPIVTLFWIFIAVAVVGAKLYYDVRHWWRWQRRAR
jgi:apolipoprotein N-acyltransferase